MAQLQGIVTDIASPKSNQKPEVIKPGVSSLPQLPTLGTESCLAFADWLHNARPALADVSDNSEELWNLVTTEASLWYARYLKLDPLGKLTSKPVPSAELDQVRWQRVSRRMESMILAATPDAVKEEVSSARISGLLPLVCKLFIIYGPGSLTEREIGLKQIQDPPQGTGVQDTIELLRNWKRWCSRMTELGGSLPDSALQVRAITRISKAALSQNPEVSFRVSLTRASLQVDMNPDDEKVAKLHAQILGELEAIQHRGLKDKDSDKDKEKAKDAVHQAKVKGVEAIEPVRRRRLRVSQRLLRRRPPCQRMRRPLRSPRRRFPALSIPNREGVKKVPIAHLNIIGKVSLRRRRPYAARYVGASTISPQIARQV